MASRRAPEEIETAAQGVGLSTRRTQELQYASRICAKVDNAAIQAGYPIYHHAFLLNESGGWAVVQQGLNVDDKTARRYHWLSDHVKSFVVEPQDAIVGETVKPQVLNMTAREAEENRGLCVDLVKENPRKLISSIMALGPRATLDRWTDGRTSSSAPPNIASFEMPTDLDWKVFSDLYDVQPRSYEELLAFRGVGPATIRALALVAQLMYGKPASWRDPVKFSFAHGGKDGVPFPVNLKAMDGTNRFLKEMIEATGVERRIKEDSLKSLGRLASSWGL
jgi:hypothetical protein